MANPQGYKIEGKVYCPRCSEDPSGRLREGAEPLSAFQITKAMKGSRPEADSAAMNFGSKPGGPSFKCNGDCGQRFTNKNMWEVGSLETVTSAYGDICHGCEDQLDSENRDPNPYARRALIGEKCALCERTSTGWEWVKISCARPDDCERKLQAMGF